MATSHTNTFRRVSNPSPSTTPTTPVPTDPRSIPNILHDAETLLDSIHQLYQPQMDALLKKGTEKRDLWNKIERHNLLPAGPTRDEAARASVAEVWESYKKLKRERKEVELENAVVLERELGETLERVRADGAEREGVGTRRSGRRFVDGEVHERELRVLLERVVKLRKSAESHLGSVQLMLIVV